MKTRLLIRLPARWLCACISAFTSLFLQAETAGPEAGRIHLQLAGGRSHQGHLLTVTPAALIIRPHLSHDYARVGVPLQKVRLLQFFPQAASPAARLPQWSLLRPLLDHLDPPTTARLLKDLQQLLPTKHTRTAFHWAEALADSAVPAADRNRAAVLATEALARMGLWEAVRQRLSALRKSIPQLQTPPILCALHARIALREQNPERALFWALVPALQIPRPEGAIAERLRRLAAFLRQSPNQPLPDHLNPFPL